MAFGADGASVNLGKKAGLAAILRKEVPHLVDFHCLPHRLELALLDPQNECKTVEDVYNVLHLIWKTYYYSPKSTRALQAIASELDVNILKPTQVKGTRWLPHISRALKVFVGSPASMSDVGQYATVLIHMEDLAINSKLADIKGRARHIVDKIKSVHFAAFCHFLADLFGILSRLSLQMQRNDIILPTVVSLLKETVLRTECLTSHPLPDGHLAKFLQGHKDDQPFQGITLKGSLESGKVNRGRSVAGNLQSEIEVAVNLTTKGLRERFEILLLDEIQPVPNSRKAPVYGPKDVVRDLLVFNVDAWPLRSSDLISYGAEEVQRLSKWFQGALETAGCTTQNIPDQWIFLKIQVNSQFRKIDYSKLWETTLTKVPYKENFKDVLHLVEILLVLPISAAQCERAVSAQNRIKSSTRASLGVSVLEDLIRISAEGPSVNDFDPAPAVDEWFTRDESKGERPRRPHFKNT